MLLQQPLLPHTTPRVIWPVWYVPPPPPAALHWNATAKRLYRLVASLSSGQHLTYGLWSLEYLRPEQILTQPLKHKRTVVTVRRPTQQLVWWSTKAWFKAKYRFHRWTPVRRLWTKRELMPLPYYRLCYDGAEVGIEHVRMMDASALQRQFAMYLAAVGSGQPCVQWMELPEDYVIPARHRGKRVFSEKGE